MADIDTSERDSLVENEEGLSTQQGYSRRDGEYTYEEAISSVGYGKFHYLLLALCGWALSSDAIEVLAISFILPPATCDLGLSNEDKGLVSAIIFAGMMFGGYLWGTLADIHGRRAVLLWSLTVNALGGLCSSVAQKFWLFLTLRFVSGIGVGGSLPVIFAYYTEFQPKEKRGSMISLLATFWMCGNILAAALAWIVIPLHIGVVTEHFTYNSWRIYLSLCTLPSMTSVLCFLIMPESPKFLMQDRKTQRAILVLRRIFHSNYPTRNLEREFKIEQLYDPFQKIRPQNEEDENVIAHSGACSRFSARTKYAISKFTNTTAQLFRQPLTKISIVMTVIYFTLSFGYYGMFLWFPEIFNRIEKYGGSPCSLGEAHGNETTNSSAPCTYNISNKIYFESFLTAVSNLPGNLFTIFMIDRVGRKLLLAVSMVISGVSVFFIALLRNSTQSLVMSCMFSAISVMGWNSLDVLGVELYPTKLRSTASGVLMSVGRIAAILGNLAFGELVDVYCLVPMFLVATLLAFGGLISLSLPNTRHTDLQ